MLSRHLSLRGLALLCLCLPFAPALVGQAIPSEIYFQGNLYESGIAVTDTRDFTFTIGGWSETHTNVSVDKGLYAVTLGAITPIPAATFDNPAATLSIQVGATTLSPTIPLKSVAFALKAEEARSVRDSAAVTVQSTGSTVSLQSSGNLTILPGGSGGSNGQFLQTDGSGNVSWATVSAGGSGDAQFAGDGSAGALVIAVPTNWSTTPPTNNNTQFTSLTINSALTVPSGTRIFATGNVTINSGGSITVIPWTDTQPQSVPTLLGQAKLPAVGDVGGVAHTGTLFFAQLLNPGYIGGSPGDGETYTEGGAGGGTLTIRAGGVLSVAGAITADGGDATAVTGNDPTDEAQGAGGGAGGIIILASQTQINASAGTLNARGGDGSDAEYGDASTGSGGGGGGGGGLVHLLAPVISSGTVNLAGGLGGTDDPSADPTRWNGGGAGGAMGGNGGNSREDSPVQTTDPGGTGVFITSQLDPTSLF